MKKLFALTVLAAALWFWRHEPEARWRGLPAARDPVQSSDSLPPAFRRGKDTITPLARYDIRAVVLARERYRYDPAARLSPVDLGLGWGPMSSSGVVNELSFSQSGRWLEYTWKTEPPLDPDLIASHSANTHCLPADDAVRRRLLAVKRHDLVTLSGFLVEVVGDDGSRWRSSLSRTDTGGGACEILWVTAVDSKPLR